jgi:hypothetical protein
MSKDKAGKTAKAAKPDTESDFARVWSVGSALELPGLELAQTFGKSSMKVAGKFVGWVKEPGILAVHCSREWKALLIEQHPGLYFETPHYEGWPAVQINLSQASDADIAEAVTRAWKAQAPKRLVTAFGKSAD